MLYLHLNMRKSCTEKKTANRNRYIYIYTRTDNSKKCTKYQNKLKTMQNTHKYTYIYIIIYIITWRLKRKIVIQQNVRDVILEIYIHTLHYLTIPYFTLPYENFVYSEATWATLKIPQSNFSLSLSNNHL